jgi:HSP20 family molecular chaperone IbpA
MAFFPINRYRIYSDPFDRLLGDQLDFFDPWSDFDTYPTALAIMPDSFRWINEPRRLTHASSHADANRRLRPQSEKFRVQLNVAGFNPQTIKTRVEGRKVIVEGKQEDRQPDGDFNIRQIRKTYELPEHADASNLTSYVTPNNMLVIEVPIRNPETERRLAQAQKDNQNLAQFGQYRHPLFDYAGFLGGSFQPRIVDTGNNGQKQLQLSMPMKDYRPEQIKVSVKNNDLIIQGEYKSKDDNRSERSFFFQSVTLPPGTQVDQLQTHLTDDGQLKIEAPFVEQKEAQKSMEGQKEAQKSMEGQKEAPKSMEGQKEAPQSVEGQKK